MRRSLAGLAPLVAALGGELLENGRRALVPGPGHGPADRSLSLLLSEGRVIVHSFAEDDWRDVLRDLRARGLVDVEGRLAGAPASVAAPPLSQAARRRVAEQLWSEARCCAGTPAERHADRRGVVRPLGAALRFHPAVAAAVYSRRGPVRPALLAAIRDPDGALCGVEVTYLGRDGRRARVATPRKTIGLRPAGAAVRLDPAGPTMIAGEGVFSCLSASQALQLPAWALLSAANLRAFRPPRGVAQVVVAADRGRVGEAAAAGLAQALVEVGVAVSVRLPPRGAADWNDAVCGSGRGR